MKAGIHQSNNQWLAGISIACTTMEAELGEMVDVHREDFLLGVHDSQTRKIRTKNVMGDASTLVPLAV